MMIMGIPDRKPLSAERDLLAEQGMSKKKDIKGHMGPIMKTGA